MHEIQKLTIDNCKLTIANFSLTPRRWMMKDASRLVWLIAGLVLGGLGTFLATGTTRIAQAATHDRFDDFIMCTGPASIFPGVSVDGLWLLDYKAGKLLGTIIARQSGTISSWAEVDLGNEFGIQPKQNVHFMMTTGPIAAGQAALYVSETTTGKLGVYTMGPRPDRHAGIAIRRHHLIYFLQH